MKSSNEGTHKCTYSHGMYKMWQIKSYYLQRLWENSAELIYGGFLFFVFFLTRSRGNIQSFCCCLPVFFVCLFVFPSRFIVSTVKFCWLYLCVVKCCHQVAVYSTTDYRAPSPLWGRCLAFLRRHPPSDPSPVHKCMLLVLQLQYLKTFLIQIALNLQKGGGDSEHLNQQHLTSLLRKSNQLFFPLQLRSITCNCDLTEGKFVGNIPHNAVVHTTLQTIGGIMLPWFILLIYQFRMMLCYQDSSGSQKSYICTSSRNKGRK